MSLTIQMTDFDGIDPDKLASILKWKEQLDSDHIRSAAPDGCECELCKAARTLSNLSLPY